MRSLPPTTPESAEERSSMDGDTQRKLTLGDQLHAQEKTLRLIIVVYGPESVLPDVLAMHTIEMIPKSMILVSMVHRRQMYGIISDEIQVRDFIVNIIKLKCIYIYNIFE